MRVVKNNHNYKNHPHVWTMPKWQCLRHCRFITSNIFKYGMTNHVSMLTFSVGYTTWAVYNYYWARQIELVTLNTRFIVDLMCNLLNHIVKVDCKSLANKRAPIIPQVPNFKWVRKVMPSSPMAKFRVICPRLGASTKTTCCVTHA